MRHKTKPRAKRVERAVSPADYREFAAASVRRCLAMPVNRRQGRAVQLIMAKAWAKLADQTEEWRREHPRSAA